MPQYQGSIAAFNLIVLALAMNTNNFAHSSFLIARNKEITAALIAAGALFVNIIVALLLVNVFHVSYTSVAIAMLFANLFLCAVSYYMCSKYLGADIDYKNFFPIRLLIPYILAVVISLLGLSYIIWVPLLLYVILNRTIVKKLIGLASRLLKDATIFNI